MLLEFDGTFLFALISFIIFVFLMNFILYRPVSKVIEERGKFYDKNSSTVDDLAKKTEKILKEKEAEILSAKEEASDILDKKKVEVNEKREIALKNKKEEISSKLSEQKTSLKASKNAIKAEIKGEVEQYVNLALRQILKEETSFANIEEERITKALEVQE